MSKFDEILLRVSSDDYVNVSTENDLKSFLLRTSKYALYTSMLEAGLRKGQAFMNALDAENYRILTGTKIDPFYKDDLPSLLRALDYVLLTQES